MLEITGVPDKGGACYALAALYAWATLDPEQGKLLYTERLLYAASEHLHFCQECQLMLEKSGLLQAGSQSRTMEVQLEELKERDPEFRKRWEEGVAFVRAQEAMAAKERSKGKIIDSANTLASQHENLLRVTQTLHATLHVALTLQKHIDAQLRE